MIAKITLEIADDNGLLVKVRREIRIDNIADMDKRTSAYNQLERICNETLKKEQGK